MNLLKIKGISRKYLRLAATYRRLAYNTNSNNLDFSIDALVDCYNHETNGHKAKSNNGYIFGKWTKDLTVVMWIEDIQKGDFCKADFITPVNKWWATKALKDVVVPCAWFPYSTERDVNGNSYNMEIKLAMKRNYKHG